MSRFDKLLEKGKYSAWFQAKYDPESYDYNMALSERQLFVQSNARVLLGQDNMGRMHFWQFLMGRIMLCLPAEQASTLTSRRVRECIIRQI